MSDIDSIANFRDFGGFKGHEGRRVRRGRLFRSGLLCDLDDAGRQRLMRLNLQIICDVRSEEEFRVNPPPDFILEPRYIHLPIEPGKRLAELSLNREDRVPERRAELLQLIYVELAEEYASVYAKYFQALLDLPAGAVLLHCTAGKDRTGFGAAVVLRSLGVSCDDIMTDYLRTNEMLDFGRFIAPRLEAYYGIEVTAEFARNVSQARAAFLQAAFKAIDNRWGSFATYLEKGLGMSPRRLGLLRAFYLE